MSLNQVYRITLSLNGSKLQLQSLNLVQAPSPHGVADPAEPVATGIIGFWLDVQDSRQQTLYRRFIHSGLPLNAEHTCKDWSGLRRRKFRFSLDVPVLPNGHSLVLFEQYQASPKERRLERRRHITTFLPQSSLQAVAV